MRSTQKCTSKLFCDCDISLEIFDITNETGTSAFQLRLSVSFFNINQKSVNVGTLLGKSPDIPDVQYYKGYGLKFPLKACVILCLVVHIAK